MPVCNQEEVGKGLWRGQNTRLEPGPFLGVGVGRGARDSSVSLRLRLLQDVCFPGTPFSNLFGNGPATSLGGMGVGPVGREEMTWLSESELNREGGSSQTFLP